MKKFALMVCLVCLVVTTTGCWSNLDLTRRAFVIAVALDQGEDGTLDVTLQIYKPISEFGAPSVQNQKSAFFNLTIRNRAVFEAIRDGVIRTGRRSQFSHMQAIIIGETLAKERLAEILDFFYRDPEVRLMTPVIIAKGKAQKYLEGKTFIENTIGSQLQKQQEFSARLTGKSVNSNLLDLAFQLKSETESAMLPYLYVEEQTGDEVVEGIALAGKNKMTGRVPPKESEYLLMLANRYEFGIIEIPCADPAINLRETFEINTVKTKITPIIKGHAITARTELQIEGTIGELACTTIKNMEEESKYNEKIKRVIEHDLRHVAQMLQQQQMDVIGVGNQIYKRNPTLWAKLKPDWPERFSQIEFDFHVRVQNSNSKMMNANPFFKNPDDS